MDETSGIPGSLPALAPYPRREVQRSLPPVEWQACLDSWIFCLEFRLRLTSHHFSSFRLSQDASGLPFLLSYLQNLGSQTDSEPSHSHRAEKALKLRHLCLLQSRRLLLESHKPLDLAAPKLFELLSNGSKIYSRSAAWRDSLKQAWKNSPNEITAAIDSCKRSLVQQLTATHPIDLRNAIILTKDLPECGLIFMTGTDYLETLMSGYSSLQKLTTEHAFLCLRCLMLDESQRQSLLLDHLYTLKSSADDAFSDQPNQSTLLSSLLVSTPLLRHLDTYLAMQAQKRGQILLEALKRYREQMLHLHPLPLSSQREKRKGKDKARATNEDMHMHKAAQVSQIHELFPDLSNAYILRLLDNFSEDVEAVTAALLEPDTLPSNLKVQNAVIETTKDHSLNKRPVTTSPSPFLPQRKNVFDDDEFDNLKISSGRVHQGRKDIFSSSVLTREENAKSKAAIMSALAAFDADEDERDDSYDVADVGGNVDDTVDTDSRNTNEELLFRSWRDQPGLFARDSQTRTSKPREQLKRDTGMTDEQIEGWAIMLNRDENMHNRLKQKYLISNRFTGNQNDILSTKWRAGPSDSDENSSDGIAKRGEIHVRGGQPFRGRGGGNTAGPGDSASTQAARKRKEQGRGRGGASHNRREGRAKKIGRGMTGPPE